MAESAEAVQTGRIANPVLGFERIVAGDELELGRALSFGLLDLLTLPARQQIASTRLEARLRLASEVVDHITRVRQAWVRAVAAQQMHQYAQQVFQSAEASAELARRMQSVGNFSRLSRAREQVLCRCRHASGHRKAPGNFQPRRVDPLAVWMHRGSIASASRSVAQPATAALEAQAVGLWPRKRAWISRLAQSNLDAAGRAQSLNVSPA